MIPIDYSSAPEGNKLELSEGTMFCVIYLSVLLFSTTVCKWTISHTSKVINIASVEISLMTKVKLRADVKG